MKGYTIQITPENRKSLKLASLDYNTPMSKLADIIIHYVMTNDDLIKLILEQSEEKEQEENDVISES